MVRKPLIQRGKFFLRKLNDKDVMYYQASGVFDVGSEREEAYLYWTKHIEYARGFRTVKTARAMAEKLDWEYGVPAVVVDVHGRVLVDG